MRKINEIFYSLQGEGCHFGVPSVFIRFSGCNLKCWFCDTPHHDGELMSDEQIIEVVKTYPGKWIILTGGEPSLWIDYDFIEKLKNETGKLVAIETNGTNKVPENIDWITVSPKMNVSAIGDAKLNIDRADEIKVVFIGQDLNPYFTLPCVDKNTQFRLQPCFENNEVEFNRNIDLTVKKILEDPRWNLSLQSHRFLGIK